MKQTFLLLIFLFMAIFNGLLAQPPNDNLCNATPLTLGMDCSGMPNISTDFATAQTNEPNFTCGNAAQDTLVYNSVWYSFVAPAGPVYLLAAPDSAIITNSFQMSVYSLNGDCADLSNLELVACNTPIQNLLPAPALIITLTEGETYYVSVSGRTALSTMATYSNTGCMSVMEVAPPANDAACDAIDLAVNADAQVFSNVGATAQPGEAAISPPAGTGGPVAVNNNGWALGTNVIDNSVWFTFTTGAAGGNYSVDLQGSTNLPGSFNTQLAVYTATDCNDFSTFTYVGASDNSIPAGGGALNLHSKLDLFCLPGNTTYHVLVDGGASFLFQPITSQGLFSIQVTAAAPIPLSIVSEVQAPDCAGGSDGTIVIAAAGGAGGFSYAWSTGESTQALRNVLPAGSYTVSITDMCGEELVETFAVPAVANDDLAVNAGEDLSGCEGSEVQLNATATGGTLMDTKRVHLQKFAGAGNHRLIAAGLQLPEMQDTISSTQTIQLNELEFVGNDLYGTSFSRYFYSINTTTGDITLVDTLLVPSVADLSYVPADGKLYLTTSDGDVYEVDPVTAGLTLAVSTGLTGIAQATIDNTGTMYVFTNASEFYSVPLATGTPTLITTVPFNLLPFRGFETDPWDDKIYLTASTTIAQGSGITWQAVLEVDKATGDRVRIYRDFTSVGPTGAFAIQGRTVAPYQYAWAPAAGLDDAAIGTPVFTVDQTTAFTVTATDFCGASSADEVTVALQTMACPPANDDLCHATPLTLGMDCSGIPNISTDFATAQAGEPNFTCGTAAQDTLVYNSVWYSFVAPAGPVYLLAAPDGATVTNSFQMSVYSLNGDCADLSNLELVACNTPIQNLQASPALIITLTEGETYYVSVSGRTISFDMITYSNTGCMSVMEIAPPANDAACDAIDLAVNADAQVFSNVGATAQPGETAISPPVGTGGPLAVGNDGWAPGTNVIDNSVWFTFTTGADGGNYSIDLQGSTNLPGSFNTQLAVYTATDCNDFSTFTYVGASDNSFPAGGGFLNIHSKLDLFCLPGNTTYHVLVDGGASFLFQPIAGQGLFSIQVTAPQPVPISTVNVVGAPVCAGGSDGTIVIAAAGGAGGFSYAWSTGDSTQALRNVLPAGSYTVTITDMCGEELVETFDMPASQTAALAVDAGADQAGCPDTQVQLNATATGGLPLDTRRMFFQKGISAAQYRLLKSRLEVPDGHDTLATNQAVQFREMEFVGDDLYAISSNRLYSVNTATGEATLVDTILLDAVVDLSYVPSQGKLFCMTGEGDIYELDPATAAVTLTVSTGLANVHQAAIDNSGTVYANAFDGNLYSIPLATGTPALIGPFNVAPVPLRALEIDPATDQLYATYATTIAQGSGISWQSVREVDKATAGLGTVYQDFSSLGPTLAFAFQDRSVEPYQYAWSPAAGLDDAAIGTPVFTVDQTTAFTVMVTDFCGTAADEITVAQLPTEMMILDTIIFIGDTYNGIVISADTTIWETFVGSNGCDGLLTINISAQPNATFETWPADAISIFPNPVASRLTLNTEGIEEKEVTVVLLDVYGQRLWQQQRTSTMMNLDVSYLPSGMYILEIRSAGKRAAKRFVKQ